MNSFPCARTVSAAAVSLLVLAVFAHGSPEAFAAVPAGSSGPVEQPLKTAWTLTGWNNLGMHCMDADFKVFSILPPYNTIHAQLVDPSGDLVVNPASQGITVTYQGVVDPAGSINTTSAGKTNFWQNILSLFGASLPVDTGLTGLEMPGAANAPQPMSFDTVQHWFIAEGIPITPYDDAMNKNPYPLMHLVARDAANNILATTDIVLPVSDEMDCATCHASGSGPAGRPAKGWVWDADAQRDYRLNILLLHDDRQAGNPLYAATLAAAGYDSAGLFASATSYGKPALCASCHLSEALPGTGQPGVPPLTASVHAYHAGVTDPTNGQTLGASTNRSACYRCHPGSTTKCLRGAMGSAVAPDGSLEMQCQGCHGAMSEVGAVRTGWLDEPTCQNCHTGLATSNNGQIRYTSVFDSPGHRRVAVNQTFATNPNTPVAPFSLYRFSKGHGALGCEGCHGSTHAEFPSTHTNDNLQSLNIQGHSGMLVECASCHTASPQTVNLGPHGMHPVGQQWVNDHPDLVGNPSACRDCHGTNYRGTVLSQAKGSRTILTEFGTKTLYKGYQVGCYNCHLGPNSSNANPNRAPVSSSRTATTVAGVPVPIALTATDADGNPLTLNLIGQPAHGTAGLAGTQATYFPDAGYVGLDSFTFNAWDNSTSSNLATVTMTVNPSPCTLSCSATVPATAPAGAPVFFQSSAMAPGCGGAVSYDWTFGDGSPHAMTQNPTTTYASADTFRWTLAVTAGTATTGTQTCVKSGNLRALTTPIVVPELLQPLSVATTNQGQDLTLRFDSHNCPSANYHVVYGYGSGLSSWSIAGGVCSIGTGGPGGSTVWAATPDPTLDPTGLLWFLAVGDDNGATEGSWGRTSSGVERGGTSASSVCGMSAKSLAAVCGTP